MKTEDRVCFMYMYFLKGFGQSYVLQKREKKRCITHHFVLLQPSQPSMYNEKKDRKNVNKKMVSESMAMILLCKPASHKHCHTQIFQFPIIFPSLKMNENALPFKIPHLHPPQTQIPNSCWPTTAHDKIRAWL